MYVISVSTDGAEPSTRVVTGELLVGRARDCDLSINDARLSRQHARLSLEGGRLFVEDLGGPNGTAVNARSITGRVPLAVGDVVTMGKTRIRVLEGEGVPARKVVRAQNDLQRTDLVKPVAADTIVHDARDFAVVQQITRAIQAERETPRMLERVLELLLDRTSCERAFAAVVDEAGELRLQATIARIPLASGVVLSRTVAEHVLDRRNAVICSDAASDTRFRDATSIITSDTRSLLAVPIVSQTRVLGIIQIESTHPARRFAERDLDLVSVVAATVGPALENIDLLERRARTIAQLEAAQAELLATQRRLVRSEQLATIGRLAAGIAHEVRNHLSPFTLASMIAEKHPEDRQLQEVTEMMTEAQQHILDLVNQVRAFASGAETTAQRSTHDVVEVVRNVMRFVGYDKSIRSSSLSFQGEGPLLAELEIRSFRQVLVNLIRNAVQASPGADARIALRVVRRGELVVVEVEDNGSGIPDDVAAHIFEPFFTTKGENGLGLGLDISRKIVEEHGGRLDFTSRVGVGTTFRVAVPAKRDETG